MALIVEDGTGKGDANAYVSTADLDAYLSLRGKSIASGKEEAIIKATDYMMQKYRGNWRGIKKTSTQALDWPRYDIVVDGYSLDSNIIPKDVKNACCELAYRAASDDLYSDLTQGVIREKIDVIEVEYDQSTPQVKRFVAVDAMLRPYLNNTGYVVGLVRV